MRVLLPQHLNTLSGTNGELSLEIPGPVTKKSVLDALEQRYPMLCGTLRDHTTGRQRPMVRFFAALEDITHEPADAMLAEAVATGREPLRIVGAIAGG